MSDRHVEVEAPPPDTGAEFAPADRTTPPACHRIVIVGGGAGGLELAARLGNAVGRRGKAEVVLVDGTLTHVWKPLLHEVATGTLSSSDNKIDYLQQARRHHFRFHLGSMEGLDRSLRQIWLAPLVDEDGLDIAPRRPLAYDTLVIAIWAIDNDFGTPGARRHAMSLNNLDDAERFHRRLLALCARAEFNEGDPVHVVIVGGGATGVELAAELTGAADEIASYGIQLQQLQQPLRITVVEAGKRILGPLPDQIVARAEEDLRARGVSIRVGQRVAEVRAEGVLLEDAGLLEADLAVWAAGVQGPPVLDALGGLETNRQRQLLVHATLQTTVDENIYAFGDCASCTPAPDGRPVPPKAQAAQQQARLLARSLRGRVDGKPPLVFCYRERGNLISLGQDQAVGSLDTSGAGKLTVGGVPARLSYWLLYRRHLALLLGPATTLLLTVGQWLSRRSRPRVKLH